MLQRFLLCHTGKLRRQQTGDGSSTPHTHTHTHTHTVNRHEGRHPEACGCGLEVEDCFHYCTIWRMKLRIRHIPSSHHLIISSSHQLIISSSHAPPLFLFFTARRSQPLVLLFLLFLFQTVLQGDMNICLGDEPH